MLLSDLGEFGLIARLTTGGAMRPDVIAGPGDDAAVLACAPGYELLATCDAVVEGRHFSRAIATPEQTGRRALAINLSDIAAMGGEPLFALVSLVLPDDTTVAWLDGLYAGMRAEASTYGVAIVGGNVAATSGPMVLDIALLGRVASGHALLRSGARPGDRLCVTGRLGAAAAGLLTLAAAPPERVPAPLVESVRTAQLTPQPRIAAGRSLAASGGVTAMLDISDGLAADLGHLCSSSEVGAVVDAVVLPVDAATREVALGYDRDPIELALYGGEDYELLFTVPPADESIALAAVRATGDLAHPIGWITEAKDGIQLRTATGALQPLQLRGWDHLRSQPVSGV